MIELYEYETAPQTRTFDTYNDVDCFNYSDVHDFTKLVKHGYSKVTDHAVRELRFGRLTREEAVALVRRYETREPQNLELFLRWLGITASGFDLLMDLHRNQRHWVRDERRQWRLTSPRDGDDPRARAAVEAARLLHGGGCDFRLTPSKRPGYEDRHYVLIGKGYPS